MIRIEIYNGSTMIYEPALERAEGITFETGYPAGLYLTASFTVPYSITGGFGVKVGQKIQFWDGYALVWEGEVSGVAFTLAAGSQSIQVTATGYYGLYLANRKTRKIWADNRLEDKAWTIGKDSADRATFERNNDRIRIIPKAQSWGNGITAGIQYILPIGTIQQVSFTYEMGEGGQVWRGVCRPVQYGIDSWSSSDAPAPDGTMVTVNMTGTAVFLGLYSEAVQTPNDSGTIYGEYRNVMVRTTTESINLTTVAKDVAAMVGELSTDTHLIATNQLGLDPFYMDTPTALNAVLDKAASFGDPQYHPWACGIRASIQAADRKPILFAEEQPDLYEAEYVVRLDEPEVESVGFERTLTEVRNWVAVQYRDVSGNLFIVTPDDDDSLKDDVSIATYGRLEEWLTVDTTDMDAAINTAIKYMRLRKDPQWISAGTFSLKGSIRRHNGIRTPVTQIKAGERIQIENYLADLNGNGLTFLITRTNYNDADRSVSLTVGRADNLDVLLARLALGPRLVISDSYLTTIPRT